MLIKIITVLLYAWPLIFTVPGIFSQSVNKEKEPVEVAKIDQNANLEKFLREDKELREIYQCRFTGRFIEISRSTQELLNRAFPNYQFRVAEMEILIDLPWKKTNLIIITSRENDEVIAFVWGGMWTMPSKSFEKIVYGQNVASFSEASEKAIAFAELLASTGPLNVGDKSATSKRIEVEILTKENNSVLRKLRLEIRHGSKLGKFLILRQDSKPIVGPEGN